jgi:hypothetical protein
MKIICDVIYAKWDEIKFLLVAAFFARVKIFNFGNLLLIYDSMPVRERERNKMRLIKL